jgi:hypothetical protein
MSTKDESGATVYELAAEFGCRRATVVSRLEKAGIAMRFQSPGAVVTDAIQTLLVRAFISRDREATWVLRQHRTEVSGARQSATN